MKDKAYKGKRIDTLEKYYPVDKEKEVVTFKLNFDHASDMFDYSIGEKGKETFKQELLDKITNLLSVLPNRYGGDIVFNINDYDDYDVETISERFIDFIQMNSFDIHHFSKRNAFISAMLIIAGFLCLTFDNLFIYLTVLDNELLVSSIIEDAINIVGLNFIWQASLMIFVIPEKGDARILKIFKNLNSFKIIKDGKEYLIDERDDLARKCRIDSGGSYANKQTLAISSSLMVSDGFLMIIQIIRDFVNKTTELSDVSVILNFALSLSMVLCGILVVMRFTHHYVSGRKLNICFDLAFVLNITCLIRAIFVDSCIHVMINLIFNTILIFATAIIVFRWNSSKYKKQK